jgi:hypothetical protein
MKSKPSAFDVSLVPQILRYVFIYRVLHILVKAPQARARPRPAGSDSAAAFKPMTFFFASLGLTLLGRQWLVILNKQVPEPYLVSEPSRLLYRAPAKPRQDEVFHIPQAQRYCEGNHAWDDKITTPPGL